VFVFFCCVLIIILFGYTKIMARFGGGPAPFDELTNKDKQADLIAVNKLKRHMVKGSEISG
jgi:hypothetical protein